MARPFKELEVERLIEYICNNSHYNPYRYLEIAEIRGVDKSTITRVMQRFQDKPQRTKS